MIGQYKLEEKLNKYTIETFPQSNIIIGDYGSGKHTFVNEVCKKFDLQCFDVSLQISKETIDELYIKPIKCVYLIDIIELAKKHRYINKENAILKFIEEPPETSIIFILAESEHQILDTIRNRCIEWRLSSYATKDLKQFKTFDDSLIYSLLNTPGKVLNSENEEYYIELFKICDNIITNINRANVSNTLSLEKHLDFTDGGKYSLRLFLTCIKVMLADLYIKSGNETFFNCMLLSEQFENRLLLLNVNEKNLFYNFILGFKDIYDRSSKS